MDKSGKTYKEKYHEVLDMLKCKNTLLEEAFLINWLRGEIIIPQEVKSRIIAKHMDIPNENNTNT